MKQTILSTKQSELLESLIVAHGRIVTSSQIYDKAKDVWSQQQTKKVIGKLAENGWLIRIKRGLYAVSDLSNRGFLSLSPHVVANLLVKDSYVSFESALSYRGLFDQLTNKVISVSKSRYKAIPINAIEYDFVKVQEKWFFGWEDVVIENQKGRIATAEKALIDTIQFHKSKYSVDLVIEKLHSNLDSLDIDRLHEYLAKMSTTTVKVFGFIFDLLGMDSSHIHSLLKNKRSTDWMFADDKKFSAKWRLYYDEYFDKYQKN